MRARQRSGRTSARRATSGRLLRSSEHQDVSWNINSIVVARFVKSALGATSILQISEASKWTRDYAQSALRHGVRRSAPCADRSCSARSFQEAKSTTLHLQDRISIYAALTATRAKVAAFRRVQTLLTRTRSSAGTASEESRFGVVTRAARTTTLLPPTGSC